MKFKLTRHKKLQIVLWVLGLISFVLAIMSEALARHFIPYPSDVFDIDLSEISEIVTLIALPLMSFGLGFLVKKLLKSNWLLITYVAVSLTLLSAYTIFSAFRERYQNMKIFEQEKDKRVINFWHC